MLKDQSAAEDIVQEVLSNYGKNAMRSKILIISADGYLLLAPINLSMFCTAICDKD